jgi:quercetin 2,3-dioxygenase
LLPWCPYRSVGTTAGAAGGCANSREGKTLGNIRKIIKVVRSQATVEGAGVRLHRAFGFSEPERYDPFLLLDDFRSDRREHYVKGFPWHPHRGIETITYVLRGRVDHGDSLGNTGTISSGDIQWMTAGSGILHEEMPKGDSDGAMHGFQLWANLPSSHKMMAPRYQDYAATEIPEVVTADGTVVKVVAGQFGETSGPVRNVVIEPEFLDVIMKPGCSFEHPIPEGHTVFAYVIGGKALFGQGEGTYGYPIEGVSYCDITHRPLIENGYLVLFGIGDTVCASTQLDPVRFLLISGKPIGEPIAWRGPIVMNTQDELKTAFEELQAGTFLKEE